MKDIPEDQVNLYSEIGRRISGRRKKIGMTQVEFAKKLGMSRSRLSNVERGAQRLLVNSLVEFASALETTPFALLPNFEQSAPNDLVLTAEEQTLVRSLFSTLGRRLG